MKSGGEGLAADAVRPNFLGIGPGKAGTTWLYQVLKEHPEVGLAAAKETLYFTSEYHRGIEWYLRLFRGCRGRPAIGEVSNVYIFDAAAADRIRAFNPAMRLISCLRDPVDRAFSHYLFLARNGQVHGTFEEVIASSPDLLERGEYFRLLQPWLRNFPPEQILLLVFDDLRERPEEVTRRMFGFIGVDPGFLPPSIRQRAMVASAPRNRAVARLVKEGALAVRRLGRPEWVQRVKQSGLARLLYRPLGRDEYPRLAPATRLRLQDRFRGDVRQLSALVGRDLESLWFERRDTAGGQQRLPRAALP